MGSPGIAAGGAGLVGSEEIPALLLINPVSSGVRVATDL